MKGMFFIMQFNCLPWYFNEATLDYIDYVILDTHVPFADIKLVVTCLENIELLWIVMLGILVDLEE